MSKLFLLGTAAVMSLTMLTNVSEAADLTGPADVAGNWEGLYLGIFGGYNDTSFDWHESAGLGNYDGNINSFNGGLFGGYNFQADRVILGLEGEASLFTGDASFSNVPGPGKIDANPDWEFAVKGRLGYDAGLFMPYLAVGYSWMKLDTTWVGPDVDVDETHQGVMAGVGTDVAIAQNFFGRIEYMHTWLSEERYTYCSPNCNADIKLGANSFRLGLGYRF